MQTCTSGKLVLFLSITIFTICVTILTASAGAGKKAPEAAKEGSTSLPANTDKGVSSSEPKHRPVDRNAAATVNGGVRSAEQMPTKTVIRLN